MADVGGGAVRTALAEAEDDALAALLWPRPLGDVSVAVRTGRSCAQLGLVLTPGPGLGGPTSGAAGPSAIDTARVAAGVFHRLPSAAVALGASAVYCPTTKGFDEANCALLVGRGASAGGAARTAALVSAAGGSSIAFSHALASIDHTGELSLGARWLLGGNCRLDARTSVDVNSKRVCKAGAHLTFSL
uniref:Uncharacterized protein n=1 Tax=Diacronema lutheri TaxID=2081491 RepID=A0A7R9UMC9_DIALT